MFIYPPRPTSLITPAQLPSLEQEGYVAQVKANGSCIVLSDGMAWNRHGQAKSNFKADISAIPKDCIVVGEYLDKAKKAEGGEDMSHKLCLFDILQHKGKSLVGTSLADRIKLLWYLFPAEPAIVGGTPIQDMSRHSEDIWIMHSYTEDFEQHYNRMIQTDLYEGIVLKRLEARLEPGSRELNNSTWQVKIRKPCKNYRQ